MNSFVQIIKKVVISKVKANLQLWATAQDMDQNCSWGSQLAHTTMTKISNQANIKGKLIKDPQRKKPKVQDPESAALQYSNNLEASAKARRKKKKDRCQNNHWQRKKKYSIPATKVNVANSDKDNKKKNDNRN